MIKTTKKRIIIAVLISCFFVTGIISCKKPEVKKGLIRFVSVSWTGVTVKTELAVRILKSLGYDATNTMVSVPIAYQALDSNEADIFLGNWMPSMKTIAEKYFKKGTVVKYVANMPGAKYTLAAPSYVIEGGLKDFSDIAKFKDKLEGRIYGIEAGNDGNEIILGMMKKNMYGLGDFKLIDSSETGMLSQVQSYIKEKKWIVFLGWAPHYMNEIIDMKYLTGSTAETFGGNDGTATVYTNIHKGFAEKHPNVAEFLKNYTFPVDMMNQVMKMLHEDKSLKPADAGLKWIKKNPKIYKKWLDDVRTVEGKPAVKAFEKYLKTI